MAKPENQDNPIKDHVPEAAFVTWDTNEEKADALSAAAGAVDSYDGIGSANASHRSFLDVESNISVNLCCVMKEIGKN